MKKEIKIGLAGNLRSGKDTVATYAEDKYGFVPFAFGTELKNSFHEEYPHVPENPKPRKGYQLYGQLMRYVHGEDHWVDITLKGINRVRRVAKNYNITGSETAFCPMITDVRQPNEFSRLEEEGYIIIKVVTPEEVRIARAEAAGDKFDLKDLQHETEQYIKDAPCDYVLINDGTFDELYAKFDVILEDILKEG